jgi:hypothetical protein
MSFILPPGQQPDSRDVSERYIGKSNFWIAMVSTTNTPEGLFESIGKESEECDDYISESFSTTIMTLAASIRKMKSEQQEPPSFEKEYRLGYLRIIGSVFDTKDIEAGILKTKK